jgi:leader peptidase (prepilin peptidase) / N-methyltransferase
MTPVLLLTLSGLFIFGACVGSFLNVCIFRIPRKKSIVFPGSACPACQAPIPIYANIPVVSFAFLRGRCLFCKHPISWRYPLVEALTGLAAVLVFLRFGLTPQAGVWFGFTATLLLVSFIDLDFQIIPDRISIPGIFIFSALGWLVLDRSPVAIGLGILTGGGILYAVALFYYLVRKTEGMGGGDIKLLAMIGAATGISGVLFTLFAGSALGTAAGLAAMVRNRHTDRQMKLPFGPYLASGALLYVFYGDMIISWYISMATLRG